MNLVVFVVVLSILFMLVEGIGVFSFLVVFIGIFKFVVVFSDLGGNINIFYCVRYVGLVC